MTKHILRGTTPLITLNIKDLSTIPLAEVWVTMNSGALSLTKRGADMTFDGDTVSFELSQSETLSLRGATVQIQARVLSTDGHAYATQIVEVPTDTVLQEGVIR